MGKKETNIRKIEAAMGDLSDQVEITISWVMDNLEFVEGMCRKPGMSPDTIARYKGHAIADKDFAMFVLLYISEALREPASDASRAPRR